ncbi:MAG: ADP-ribosylglycohydrolase family protein [Spirochaetaceae bacterium]|nr:ADP-ribosylglycohydrolase family protein [Spirochaetaceae bacterium]
MTRPAFRSSSSLAAVSTSATCGAAADTSALPESAIRSGGFVIDTLEAALWRFLATDTCRGAVLKAVNLGDDTDTTAAVTGGIAGLFYGKDAIPADWLQKLAGVDGISRIAVSMADALTV